MNMKTRCRVGGKLKPPNYDSLCESKHPDCPCCGPLSTNCISSDMFVGTGIPLRQTITDPYTGESITVCSYCFWFARRPPNERVNMYSPHYLSNFASKI